MNIYLRPILLLALVSCTGFVGFAQAPAQSPAPSRQESEPAIRTAIYESAMSALTGDIKLYRKNAARRTLELSRLTFEGLREIPDGREMLTDNQLDTADKFIDTMFVQGASHYANLSRDEMEQQARAQSNGTLTFLNDREAILRFGGSTLRVVYEDKAWKVDETESVKEMFLQTFPFTAETRAKIQKL